MASSLTKTIMDATEAEHANEITAGELKRRQEDGEDLVLLDVREPSEFSDWHIPGAVNLPLGDLQAGAEIPATEEQTVVTVCASGRRAGMAQEHLVGNGYEAVNLKDGMFGWNRVFEVVDATTTDTGTEVLQFQRTGKGCLSYMVVNGDDAIVIDPAHDTSIYTKEADRRGVEIVAVIDTHAHADHVSGGPDLAEELGVGYHLHPYDAIHPIDMLPARIDYEPVTEGTELAVGDTAVEVLHVPGHTLGNTALLVEGTYLFTGDTIFIDSIARPDLGGQAERWTPLHHRSLQRLLALPDEVTILPGHYAGDDEKGDDDVVGAPLGKLREENHGLQMATRDAESFEAFIQSSLPSFPERYVEIKRVNAGLVHPDDDGLEDLEFGQQECALSEH